MVLVDTNINTGNCPHRATIDQSKNRAMFMVKIIYRGSNQLGTEQLATCRLRLNDRSMFGYALCDHPESDEAHCPVAKKYTGR